MIFIFILLIIFLLYIIYSLYKYLEYNIDYVTVADYFLLAMCILCWLFIVYVTLKEMGVI